jgi:polyhydroxyalkanoate synthase
MLDPDFLAQCTRWIDQMCEFNKTLIEEVFDRVERKDDAPEKTLVKTATECGRHVYEGLTNNPEKIVALEISYWQSQLQLYTNFMRKLVSGEPVNPMVRPKVGDRRFSDPAWDESNLFDFLKQSYLLTADR